MTAPVPLQRRAAAARQRRARQRRRQGLVAWRVVGHEHRIIEALIVTGRLSEDEALRPPLVERELAKLLSEWAERWI